MADTIVMPQQGNSVESVILLDWHKKVGDTVAVDETLCEVETDKTTMEVPATASGTILALLANAGDEVAVMAPIAVVGTAGEAVPAGLSSASAAAEPASMTAASKATPAAPPAPAAATPAPPTSPAPDASTDASSAPYGKLRVSPRARGEAERRGVDLAMVEGSGPGGRILVRDVESAGAGAGAASANTSSSISPAATPASRGAGAGELRAPAVTRYEETAVRGVRATIASRMRASLQETAQLTLNAWADARALQGYRARLKAAAERGEIGAVSINDMVLYAVARVLTEFPDLNAHFLGTTLRRFEGVDLGFAVDTDRGLLVPTIPNADRLSLRAIGESVRELAGRARDGKAGAGDLAPATFTVTNLGALGIESFTPLINPPQVAILGVGAIALRAVADGAAAGGVAHIPHMSLSLTIDHQAVDGAPGARFLKRLCEALASFDVLLAG